MISEYFRPDTLEEAIALLTNPNKDLKPLGGGTKLSRQQMGDFGVVDLQSCSLDKITLDKQRIRAGALVRLQNLLDHKDIHPEIKSAIRIDSSQNIRNAASLGGWLISSDGRSILSTVFLALDALITWEPETKHVSLGDWLPMRSIESPGVLITAIDWQPQTNLAFDYVARSPKDRPIVIAAVGQWPSGRTRVALGGFGDSAVIAMDGIEAEGADIASKDAYSEAGDVWATALYRREVAAKLVLRCLERLEASKESEV